MAALATAVGFAPPCCAKLSWHWTTGRIVVGWRCKKTSLGRFKGCFFGRFGIYDIIHMVVSQYCQWPQSAERYIYIERYRSEFDCTSNYYQATHVSGAFGAFSWLLQRLGWCIRFCKDPGIRMPTFQRFAHFGDLYDCRFHLFPDRLVKTRGSYSDRQVLHFLGWWGVNISRWDLSPPTRKIGLRRNIPKLIVYFQRSWFPSQTANFSLCISLVWLLRGFQLKWLPGGDGL